MNCSNSTKIGSLIVFFILSVISLILLLVFKPGPKVVTIEQKVEKLETYTMENRSDLMLFKPEKRISITLSEDGLYHISFAITVNCEIMKQKEVYITHETKQHKITRILMQKEVCGSYKSSCFEQKLFVAKEYDSVQLRSDCKLNEYAGNFLMLAHIEDSSK